MAVDQRCYALGGAFHPGDGTVLREFVVNWLGAEDGADEVLRRPWARHEAAPGADYRAVFLRLIEKAAHELRRKAPGSAGNCADTSRPMIAGNQPDALP